LTSAKPARGLRAAGAEAAVVVASEAAAAGAEAAVVVVSEAGKVADISPSPQPNRWHHASQ